MYLLKTHRALHANYPHNISHATCSGMHKFLTTLKNFLNEFKKFDTEHVVLECEETTLQNTQTPVFKKKQKNI